MLPNREWMYTMRATNNGYLHPDFACYVTSFLDFAFSNPNNVGRKIVDDKEVFQIRCPCFKCNNRIYKTRDLVELDIFTSGFMPDYYIWYAHGESYHIPSQPVGQCSIPTPTLSMGQCSNPIPSQHVSQGLNSMGFEHGEYDGYDQMVMDSMQHNNVPQDPNPTAKKFDDMLKDVNVPLWDGCQNHSKLSAATRLLNWKSECNVADSTYDKLLPIIKEMLPDGERLPRNFYETKIMLKLLELPKERIHACKNHCMLFYKEHLHLDHCRVCKAYRFKSYNSKTAKHLTWHSDHQREPGKMIHPSDGQAWKHFDKIFPDFAQETRNVRIGLCTDGFSPNNSSSTPYSCWPVFLSIYNLPPWLALKDEYIKIPLLIPGRKSPGQNLDVFLQPLIEELKLLFTSGIETYDAHRRNNFQMRVVLLWTISDFPAYAMLSGWSTHGRLACPYRGAQAGSIQLKFGRKSSWFDCHRKHLPEKHSFRKDKVNFLKNRREPLVTPIPEPTGDQIWQQVRLLPTVYKGRPYRAKGKKPDGFGVTHNWVKRSIFWELPYWRKLLIRHNLDVMHIEKNVFDNLFHIIMGTPKSKDHLKARKDIAVHCNRPLLNPISNNGDHLKGRQQRHDTKRFEPCELSKGSPLSPASVSNIGIRQKRIRSSSVVGNLSANLNEAPMFDDQEYETDWASGDDNVGRGSNDKDIGDDIVGRGSNIILTHPANSSHKPWIQILGKGFSDPSVHRQISGIVTQFIDGPWPTWKKVPVRVRKSMFERFRGLYQWLVTEEARIFETFKNVAKNRYRDVICEARDASALAAKKAGFDMPPNTKDFSVMVDFPPDWIEGEVWKALCEIWNTDSWKKNSQTAKSNRKSSVSGSISTHTSGSINTEQHRAKMKKENGIDPTWGAVFKQTHLEKSAKLKLAAGESIGSKPEDWAGGSKSQIAVDLYEKAMLEKCGPDLTLHPLGDDELWERCAGGKKKGKVYGVGSSDPSYAVSGLSGGYDCGSSNQEHALSQKVIELESRLEKDRLEREEMEARFEREVKERKDMEARFNIQMLEVVKKFTENGKVAVSSV
ncbi:hypothetical protein LXL04_034672 [Taraxacum kok-saghyz]